MGEEEVGARATNSEPSPAAAKFFRQGPSPQPHCRGATSSAWSPTEGLDARRMPQGCGQGQEQPGWLAMSRAWSRGRQGSQTQRDP